MTRLVKILGVAGFASVYLMQTPCTFLQHGFSVLPNIGGQLFAGLFGNLLGGLGT